MRHISDGKPNSDRSKQFFPMPNEDLEVNAFYKTFWMPVLVATCATVANAQPISKFKGYWAFSPSGDRAARGWEMLGASTLEWPDGGQALVTYWRSPSGDEASRCIDHFDAAMMPTGGVCEDASGSGFDR